MAERLGNYEILSELGRGGMGVVYKAQDTRLGRIVAIKELLLQPGMADAERTDTIERFRREAMAAARMAHPAIVTVFDYGQDGDRHYMAMELLEGKSLGDYLEKKTRFSFQQVVDISVQVCAALDYAHQAGVVHRDIKPDNVMLSESGSVKLTDFGVARVKSDLPSMTTTGTTLGTIAYISPEQLCDSRLVDGRADLFSLGAMIYEMLTFRTPFDAGNLGGTIVNIMNAAPTPPCEINPQIPPKLEAVVLKALRKNPEERYVRAAEMAIALQQALREAEKPPAPKIVEAPAAAPPDPCRHCGEPMPVGSRVCPSCGKSGTAPLTLNLNAAQRAAVAPGSAGAPPRMPSAGMPAPGSAGGPPKMPVPSGPAPGSVGGPPRMPPPATAAGSNVPRMPAAHPGATPPRMPTPTGQPSAGAVRPAMPAMPGQRGTGPLVGAGAAMELKVGVPVIQGLERSAPAVVLRVTGLKPVSTFGRPGVGQGEFQNPRCVAIDEERNLVVADTENGRLQFFDMAGHYLRTIKPSPSQESYRFPRSLATALDGRLLVTDDVDHRVFRLSLDGVQPAIVWRRPREENPTVPARVLVGPTGHVYLSEPNTHRVMVYDVHDKLVGVLGREQGLQSPGGMAIAPNGNLLVLDFGASCLFVFNPRGEKVATYGRRGAALGELAVPRDLVVDKYGNIFVSDTLNHRIQIFDPEGRALTTYGRKGPGFGEFNGPEGLAITSDDRLIVSDRGNGRIQILALQRA